MQHLVLTLLLVGVDETTYSDDFSEFFFKIHQI